MKYAKELLYIQVLYNVRNCYNKSKRCFVFFCPATVNSLCNGEKYLLQVTMLALYPRNEILTAARRADKNGIKERK